MAPAGRPLMSKGAAAATVGALGFGEVGEHRLVDVDQGEVFPGAAADLLVEFGPQSSQAWAGDAADPEVAGSAMAQPQQSGSQPVPLGAPVLGDVGRFEEGAQQPGDSGLDQADRSGYRGRDHLRVRRRRPGSRGLSVLAAAPESPWGSPRRWRWGGLVAGPGPHLPSSSHLVILRSTRCTIDWSCWARLPSCMLTRQRAESPDGPWHWRGDPQVPGSGKLKALKTLRLRVKHLPDTEAVMPDKPRRASGS